MVTTNFKYLNNHNCSSSITVCEVLNWHHQTLDTKTMNYLVQTLNPPNPHSDLFGANPIPHHPTPTSTYLVGTLPHPTTTMTYLVWTPTPQWLTWCGPHPHIDLLVETLPHPTPTIYLLGVDPTPPIPHIDLLGADPTPTSDQVLSVVGVDTEWLESWPGKGRNALCPYWGAICFLFDVPCQRYVTL